MVPPATPLPNPLVREPHGTGRVRVGNLWVLVKQQNQTGSLPETTLNLPLPDQFASLLHELGRELWTKLRKLPRHAIPFAFTFDGGRG